MPDRDLSHTMPDRDYSDSDDEAGPSHVASSTNSPRANTRVKLTLRPSINHLMNDTPPPSNDLAKLEKDPSARSSLSPPPPLTLKFGPRSGIMPSGSSSKAGSNAHYSDSSEDEKPPPAKKAKKSKKVTGPAGGAPSSAMTTVTLPAPDFASAPKRSKYDWLQPSSVGASHHGPPERVQAKVSGWSPGDSAPGSEGTPEVKLEKKISLKVSKPSGPGKAWRKGVKNGHARPNSVHAYTNEGYAMPQSPEPLGSDRMQDSRMFSPDSASDIYASNAAIAPIQAPVPIPAPLIDPISRPPSPPFVLADASVLGFPVFKRPIAPPKMNLTLFPKVSPWFAPLNGGDVGAFPRKESVRKWGHDEKSFVGIGGGTLKYKTWTKQGPPSELSRLVRADKEAQAILGAHAKAAAKQQQQKPAAAPTTSTPMTTTPLNTTPTPTTERPPLTSLVSSESTPTLATNDAAADEYVSEIGDGEESVASMSKDGAATPMAVPAGAPSPAASAVAPKRKQAAKPKAKAGPRKSKLAQEIHPAPLSDEGSARDAIEDIM